VKGIAKGYDEMEWFCFDLFENLYLYLLFLLVLCVVHTFK